MNRLNSRIFFFRFGLLAAFCLVSAIPGLAQRRDYMTEAEVELVRDAQDIDKRVDVLTRMIDRRLALLGLNGNGFKETTKTGDPWGEAPKGTRLELIGDVRSLLQKAVDDVDDVAMHNESTLTQNKTDGLLFPKAVRSLATAAARYKASLGPIAETAKDDKEKGLLAASIELCDQIVEAAATLPPEKKKGKS
jgi:hypothetical protein